MIKLLLVICDYTRRRYSALGKREKGSYMTLTSRFRALRWSLGGAVALLALVYILGMSLNLGFGSFAMLMNIHMGIGALTLLAGLAATTLALLERQTGGAI